MSGIILCLFFSDRILSFAMVSSRLIYVVGCVRISFFCRAGWCSIICMEHIWFIYSFVRGHLCSFHVLAIVSDVAMNEGEQIPLKLRYL